MLFSIGRVCIKLAGRDAGKFCTVVQQLEDGYVLIDGQTRRKKCNVAHLEPTAKSVDLSANASSEDVAVALATVDIQVTPKAKSRSPAPKPVKQRKAKN